MTPAGDPSRERPVGDAVRSCEAPVAGSHAFVGASSPTGRSLSKGTCLLVGGAEDDGCDSGVERLVVHCEIFGARMHTVIGTGARSASFMTRSLRYGSASTARTSATCCRW